MTDLPRMSMSNDFQGNALSKQWHVPGNSGCKVELLFNHTLLIRKTSMKVNYDQRLRAQRIKQENCRTPVPGIIVPRVVEYDDQSFTMEHLQMLDAIEFLERANPTTIQNRLQVLFAFLQWELESSQIQQVAPEVFIAKIISIREQTSKKIWQSYYEPYTNQIESFIIKPILLPLGFCHGDLTFSNLMFAIDDNQVGLIDFLDSFIESPLIDLVKLRQDTRFHWTDIRYLHNHDRGKIFVVNQWIDQLLCKRFSEWINSNSFWVLEMFNYLRIAPYCITNEDHEFLANALRTLVAEQESQKCI